MYIITTSYILLTCHDKIFDTGKPQIGITECSIVKLQVLLITVKQDRFGGDPI